MRVSVGRFRIKALAVVVGALVAGAALTASPSSADTPVFVPWSSLLPTFTTQYQPTSSNVCVSGDNACVDAVIAEMAAREAPLDASCSHNEMFALMYLRTTQQYQASALTPGFFTDPAFINHQDALFGKYYFDAWDAYRAGDLAHTPKAWQVAFRTADQQRVLGLGNMLLGMSAHVNRDLPYVLAEIGLVKPDGTSRKVDHDKVNEFLNLVIEPLIDEAAARFDPSVDDAQFNGTTMDETAILQLLVGWREQAWRNAEALVSAPTSAARALVSAEIERTAQVEADLLLVATSYAPTNLQQILGELVSLGAAPSATLQAQADRAANQLHGLFGTIFTPGATLRNSYCASHG